VWKLELQQSLTKELAAGTLKSNLPCLFNCHFVPINVRILHLPYTEGFFLSSFLLDVGLC